MGKDIFLRGIKGNIRSIYSKKYSLTLFDILKTYSSIIMTKDFQKMNIPKLPVFTTEDGISRIKEFLNKLSEWKNLNELVPTNFQKTKNLKKSGKAGLFSGSLELVKEGSLLIKQEKLFDEIYIKQK